jgi:hypothetical protein
MPQPHLADRHDAGTVVGWYVALKKEANAKLCESLRSAHDKIMVRLSKSLADVHAAYVELFAMKRGLHNNGIGYGTLFNVEPTFLDHPMDRTSELADFFRDAKNAGYISSVPAELS